jgi:aquaporin Z
MDMPRRLGAEFFGTFWLTFAGCGSAVLAAGFPALGIGFLGVSLAFGLTVLTMAYAVGHVSGGISIVRSQSGSGLEAASRRVT